jgi:hypothetical protein
LGPDKGSFPERRVVEERLQGLLDERLTREEVAAWAWPFVEQPHPPVTDFPAWDALESLAMCDGRHDNGNYMYDKVSFRAWLEQLRASPAGVVDK